MKKFISVLTVILAGFAFGMILLTAGALDADGIAIVEAIKCFVLAIVIIIASAIAAILAEEVKI